MQRLPLLDPKTRKWVDIQKKTVTKHNISEPQTIMAAIIPASSLSDFGLM